MAKINPADLQNPKPPSPADSAVTAGTETPPETETPPVEEVTRIEPLVETTLKVGDKCFLYNSTPYMLRDPYTKDVFEPGVTVRVRELGSWTHSQVLAGLLREGKAEDVGADPEDNSDYQADVKSGKIKKS